MTDDLITWLRAQLDEDEQLARAYLARRELEGTDRETWAYKLILADVDAKRRIVDECEYEIRDSERRDTGDGLGLSETMLGLLALPYAGRPGYRDEWRP